VQEVQVEEKEGTIEEKKKTYYRGLTLRI